MEQLKTTRNGEKVNPTFSVGEMNRRLPGILPDPGAPVKQLSGTRDGSVANLT